MPACSSCCSVHSDSCQTALLSASTAQLHMQTLSSDIDASVSLCELSHSDFSPVTGEAWACGRQTLQLVLHQLSAGLSARNWNSCSSLLRKATALHCSLLSSQLQFSSNIGLNPTPSALLPATRAAKNLRVARAISRSYSRLLPRPRPG